MRDRAWVIVASSIISLQACGPGTSENPAADPMNSPAEPAALAEAPSEVTEPASLSDKDLGRVCRAAIADLNGHDPKIMKIDRIDQGIARVSYSRPSDGKIWINECRTEGDRIIWRTVDAFGSGSGTGRWRTDPADEVITFRDTDGAVSITTNYSDGSGDTATYVLR